MTDQAGTSPDLRAAASGEPSGDAAASSDLWADNRMTSLRMAAYPCGDPAAPTVVVLHGLGTAVDVLREAVARFDPFAALSARGCNVLALDWPGHGHSGGARGHLTYRLAMEAAATAVDAACEMWDGPVVLLGVELGGTLACYAAIEDDRVRAVVSHGLVDLRDIEPVLRRLRQQALLPLAARAHRMLRGDRARRLRLPLSAVMATRDRALDPRLARILRHHPQAVSTYDLQGLASILLTPEDKPSLAALTTPTLVAVGGNDNVFPAAGTRAAASQVPGLQEVWVLPGAGHQLLLEHAPALLPKVTAFLDARVR